MQRRDVLNLLIRNSGVAMLAGSVGGCGLLLHPGRNGAPHNNQIDWKVAALDGLGLILFFVPGVVAFAVDFYTGAIYLPADNRHAAMKARDPELQRHTVPREQLQVMTVEQVVSDHIGQTINLRDETTRVSKLSQVDTFAVQVDRHQNDRTYGQSLATFFAPWKQAFGLQA